MRAEVSACGATQGEDLPVGAVVRLGTQGLNLMHPSPSLSNRLVAPLKTALRSSPFGCVTPVSLARCAEQCGVQNTAFLFHSR